MASNSAIEAFEGFRPNLTGIAYRILGSRADAEDAVQDTFLKWVEADHEEITSPPSWLTTVCTRRCLDLLRSANRARVDYVGVWLPEPVQTDAVLDAEEKVELASSLRTAFLLMLDRLSPKERAAFLMREIFDMDYTAISQTLEIDQQACRKLVSRSRQHVAMEKVRQVTSMDTQERLLNAFQDAIISGTTQNLVGMLSADVRFFVDHGGKAASISRVLNGIHELTGFIAKGLHLFWDGAVWERAEINGAQGFVLRDGNTLTAAVLSLIHI